MEKGVLLHISSLPGGYGIGSFGKAAYDFVDRLAEKGYTLWQVLPLTPTSFGDSPYQSPSAFAGNPYFIDCDFLTEKGLLTGDEAVFFDCSDEKGVNYGELWNKRYLCLRKAFERFVPDDEYYEFVGKNARISDYAVFAALKKRFGHKDLSAWPAEFRSKKTFKESMLTPEDVREVEFNLFLQFEFFGQYANLKKYANDKGVKIVGDMPVYVSMDSADVWADAHLFLLGSDLKPTFVAGVPPDGFTEDGQLWGNPLYDYEAHKKDGYKWWTERILYNLDLFDYLRIDHFRGFESYYKVPFGAKTAKDGEWVKGPGEELFGGISAELKNRIIAEDLGVITDEVRRLRKETGFMGMKVLQFAFSTDTSNEYLPLNYDGNNYALYTGTHDNDTTNGWFGSLSEKEKTLFCRLTGYFDDKHPFMKMILGNSAVKRTPAEALIAFAEKADVRLLVVPIQDILNLGSEARMNFPSKQGQWTFRLNDVRF